MLVLGILSRGQQWALRKRWRGPSIRLRRLIPEDSLGRGPLGIALWTHNGSFAKGAVPRDCSPPPGCLRGKKMISFGKTTQIFKDKHP